MGQIQTKKRGKRAPSYVSKDENFIKHGGILLEKQLALSRGQKLGPRQLKFFPIKDIDKATNGYDPNLIVGSVRSDVYKGNIDECVVAIKVIQDLQRNSDMIDVLLTDAAVGMVVDHVNIVKLYGCCLETRLPISVYEFLSNGSLFEHLHVRPDRIRWTDRVKIATDTAYALSYLHNALPKPVVHRDVQSSNVILDHSFRAKLSNFGYSVSITPGDTSQRWPVRGTLGYVDPEYVETQEVTDKCDVYSFGVFLLELLTGKQPFVMARRGMDLVDLFVSVAGDDCGMEMMDVEVLEQASRDEIVRVARLAMTCVLNRGVERPTMIEVVKELWLIQGRGDG